MANKPKNEQSGFKVEGPHSAADLDHLYPQEPQNAHASVAQLLERRASEGWNLQAFSVSAGHWHFVFVKAGA